MTDILGLLLLGFTLGIQEVREEKHLDDHKKDKQLDADNQPQGLTHSHAAEAIIIQVEHTGPESLFHVLFVTHGESVLGLSNTKLMI
jgi:hypothetical protein